MSLTIYGECRNSNDLLGLNVMRKFAFLLACDRTLTGTSGTFTSPGYPSSYPDSKECQTTITVDKGKIITLTFSTFDLEESSGCFFDFVEIIEGDRKKKYCGKAIPPAYRSKGNSIVVKFKSDSYFNGKGFSATFNAISESSYTLIFLIVAMDDQPSRYILRWADFILPCLHTFICILFC